MDEFSYLSVLLSIIIGLAVTQILQGFRARMLSHTRVRRYWPVQVWSAILLVICTQMWWAMLDLRHRTDWKIDDFMVLLTQTILVYLLAGLVFPDFRTGRRWICVSIISRSGRASSPFCLARRSSVLFEISC